MPTALAALDSEILDKLSAKYYRALDLIEELDASYSESEIQKSLASLLSSHRVVLTSDRHLKIEDSE